jgi:hypothetical protein
MQMTPRQLEAFVFLAAKRRRAELREQLHMTAVAARSDERTIRTTLREWED